MCRCTFAQSFQQQKIHKQRTNQKSRLTCWLRRSIITPTTKGMWVIMWPWISCSSTELLAKPPKISCLCYTHPVHSCVACRGFPRLAYEQWAIRTTKKQHSTALQSSSKKLNSVKTKLQLFCFFFSILSLLKKKRKEKETLCAKSGCSMFLLTKAQKKKKWKRPDHGATDPTNLFIRGGPQQFGNPFWVVQRGSSLQWFL